MKKLNIILCLVSLVFSPLFGRLEDHFKRASAKVGCHSIKNVDFIYMINLDQRPEKYQRSIAQLHPFGIYPYRFSAVNGWEFSFEDIQDIGVKYYPPMKGGYKATSYLGLDFRPTHEVIQNPGQTYFCHCMSLGAMGCYLSHLSVLQDAYDAGYEVIWVMEDDIEVFKDPRLISKLIEKLDKKVGRQNWDILFTDKDTRDSKGNYVPCYGAAQRLGFQPKNQKKLQNRFKIDENFQVIGARFGAYSMIINRKGMEKILSFAKKYNIFLPYDMEFHLHPSIRLFTVLDDVVGHIVGGVSDNGSPMYLRRPDES